PGIASRSTTQSSKNSALPSLLRPTVPEGGSLPIGLGRGGSKEGDSSFLSKPLNKNAVSREDFEVLRVLGEGGFAQVKLVKYQGDGKLYAMKAVEKAVLIDRRYAGDSHAEERAQVERDIGVAAQEWKCPFIVMLFAAFQTDEKLYYILEYCEGGELFRHLKAQPHECFAEETASFYAAEICLALRHLHQNDTIHRDVRLENVLLCNDGHIKLADFGIAKMQVSPTGQRPSHMFSFEDEEAMVHYPPEFYRGESYGKDLDCWQLGVATFVMLSGRLPSGQATGVWPGELPGEASEAASDFCGALLQEEQLQRLGHPEGAEQLLTHSFFERINWKALEQKDITPPDRRSSQVTAQGSLPMERHPTQGWKVSNMLKLRGFSFTGPIFRGSNFLRISGKSASRATTASSQSRGESVYSPGA
ncbi:unnamed protein product, partial [Polarella glacialis]